MTRNLSQVALFASLRAPYDQGMTPKILAMELMTEPAATDLPERPAEVDPVVVKVQTLERHGWQPLGQAVLRACYQVATGGSCTLVSDAATWVVPQGCGVFIPAGTVQASLTGSGRAVMQTVEIDAQRAAPFGDRCRVMEATPLLRALVTALGGEPADSARREATTTLLLDEIGRARVSGFALPDPADPRLRRVARRVWSAPAEPLDVDGAAALATMSRRTFTRRFGAETGMGFDAWQRRLRLLTAVPRLEEGVPVSIVAFDLGYDSVSAFIAAFKRAFGETPKRFGRASVRAAAE
ncbi:hypothetical protein GCM10009099_22860 [Caenispirillum bisanense]